MRRNITTRVETVLIIEKRYCPVNQLIYKKVASYKTYYHLMLLSPISHAFKFMQAKIFLKNQFQTENPSWTGALKCA